MYIIIAIWEFFLESAPFLILGFLIAGVINLFLNIDYIKKHLSGKSIGSIVKAALFGIPLPLCSCSVIPAAVTLKKNGASNASTSSFLVATPESGIDSIMMTYSVLDIPMTFIRPIAAFLTALLAGIFQNMFNDFEYAEDIPEVKSCCMHKKKDEDKDKSENVFLKIIKYSFSNLSDDIAFWLGIGLVTGGIMSALIPSDFFLHYNGITAKLIMLAIGIPLYICASSSTPIVASLMLKGMSPGTALIFLLVGPATNISNISVLQKYLGRKGVIINILTISIVALTLSFVVDFLYDYYNWPMLISLGESGHEHHKTYGIIDQVFAIFLVFLILKGIWIKKIKKFFS